MTQTDVFLNGMNFEVTGIERIWEKYGITQYYGAFGGKPRRYQIVSLKTPQGVQNEAKSWSFIPIPNEVAKEIVHYVANELGMEIKNEYNNGRQYLAQLVSKVTGEVVPGDLVAWGILAKNDVFGSFRTDTSLLRLECSNGMMAPVDSKIARIEKSYDIEKMKDSFLSKAKILQNMFEEELERFRQYKRYKMNKELAENLAKELPNVIIDKLINVGENKTVIGFSDVDLWTAYMIITEALSHRELELTTQADWTKIVTKRFDENIEKQKKQAQISS